jgi:ectoine hydroxylase-related dioxygenase (phytanoyl-CoA dioxygenase family)
MSHDPHTDFLRDGVVCIRHALDSQALELAVAAFQWSLDHPGPGAGLVLRGRPGAFYQDHANPDAFATYRPLICETRLADLVSDVVGSRQLWLLYEQIWLKQDGAALPTPWHQDLPYIPLAGQKLATVWLTLDRVERNESLCFVKGSHLGPLFNPSAFDAHDPSAAMFDDAGWPPLPDIEATRDSLPIVTWDVSPGDVLIFHPAMLHGGAPTSARRRRRTISLRFFGDDAHCAPRPNAGLATEDQLTYDNGRDDPMIEMAHRAPGTPFRHPGFHRLR